MPDNTLAKFEPGMEAIPAADLNALGRAADAFLGSDFGAGFRDGNGLFTADPRGGSGGVAKRFKITEVNDDYLVCRELKGETVGTVDVLVAKPRDLQKTYLTSQSGSWVTWYYDLATSGLIEITLSFTITSGGGLRDPTVLATSASPALSEVWIMSPPYRVGEELNAVRPAGGTGVSVAGNALSWMDTNGGSHTWGRPV